MGRFAAIGGRIGHWLPRGAVEYLGWALSPTFGLGSHKGAIGYPGVTGPARRTYFLRRSVTSSWMREVRGEGEPSTFGWTSCWSSARVPTAAGHTRSPGSPADRVRSKVTAISAATRLKLDHFRTTVLFCQESPGKDDSQDRKEYSEHGQHAEVDPEGRKSSVTCSCRSS